MAEAQGQLAARNRLVALREEILSRPDAELPEKEFRTLIQYWNSQLAAQRDADARDCRAQGHRHVATPLRDDGHPILVCLGCLSYRSTAPGRCTEAA